MLGSKLVTKMGRANGTLELRRSVSGTVGLFIWVALLAAQLRRYARNGLESVRPLNGLSGSPVG